jgi:hypothetical protein
MANHIKKCCEQTKQRIDWLVRLEQRPFTLNDHYYFDYRQKFTAHYRGWRQEENNPKFLKYIRQHMSKQSYDVVNENPVPGVMSSLARMSVFPNPVQLAALLPPDPMDPAIHIMASVRAYFQGMYARGASPLMSYSSSSSCVQTLCRLHRHRHR